MINFLINSKKAEQRKEIFMLKIADKKIIYDLSN